MSQFYCWINRFLYFSWAFLKPFAQVQSTWMWPSVLQVNYSREKKTNAFLKTCLRNFLCTTGNNSVSVLLEKLKLPEDRFRVRGNCPSEHEMHCWSNSSAVATNTKWTHVSTSHLILNTPGNEKKQLTLLCRCNECMASSGCWTQLCLSCKNSIYFCWHMLMKTKCT